MVRSLVSFTTVSWVSQHKSLGASRPPNPSTTVKRCFGAVNPSFSLVVVLTDFATQKVSDLWFISFAFLLRPYAISTKKLMRTYYLQPVGRESS